MKPVIAALLALVCLAAVSAPAAAQEEATATHVVMRYFKCSPQGVAVRMFQQGRPVVDEMIEEGKFVGYGLLAHSWGDEWNVMDWFAVDGIDSFFDAFNELNQRMNAAAEAAEAEGEEDEFPPFNEVCTDHKDNIYAVVQPPEEG